MTPRRRCMSVRLAATSAVCDVGTAVAVAAAKRGQVPELPPPLEFLAVPLGNLAIFAVLVAVGLYNRRKRDSHKRLMMLATIVTAGAASRTYLDRSCLVA